MITVIHQPHRKLTVSHGKHLEVVSSGRSAIIVSYKDHCNTCEPQMVDIQGDVDLDIVISTPSD